MRLRTMTQAIVEVQERHFDVIREVSSALDTVERRLALGSRDPDTLIAIIELVKEHLRDIREQLG